ncbi:MAG: hypothetical protein ACI89T_002642 [Cognaticolwellia sp.]|jgi:hypothetical protein
MFRWKRSTDSAAHVEFKFAILKSLTIRKSRRNHSLILYEDARLLAQYSLLACEAGLSSFLPFIFDY